MVCRREGTVESDPVLATDSRRVSKCLSGLSPRYSCLPSDACLLAACRTGPAECVPEPSPTGLGALAHMCVQPRPGAAFGDSTFARVLQPSWDKFPDLPGRHLCWRGQRGVELTLVEGMALATGKRTGIRAHQIKVDERLFEYSNIDRYFSRKGWFGGDPHFRNDRQLVELPSADPVFRVEGGHYNHRAERVVTFPDASVYRFPVWGPLKRAVMVCADDRGNSVLHYLYVPRQKGDPMRVEVAVGPSHTLTAELTCLIAISSTFLTQFFRRPSGA
jgi:hypothetical protein